MSLLPAPLRFWQRRDWLICAGLFIAAMALYCLDRPHEIRGDDDYQYPENFSMITDALLDFNAGSLSEARSSMVNLAAQLLCAPRHAPLPAVANAAFYLLANALNLPFSMNLLHLPTGLMGALSVVLLYRLLRRGGRHSRLRSTAGAVLLLVSPLFAMVNRGIGAYYLAFVPLISLAALSSLDLQSQACAPRWRTGLALMLLILGDLLWFITLPLLLVAYVQSSRQRRETCRQLLSAPLLIPTLVAITLVLLGAGVAAHKGLATPLLKLIAEHGTRISHGAPILSSPLFLGSCLTLLLGLALPVLAPLGVALWFKAGRPLQPGLTTAFALGSLLVFGTLFYALTPEWRFVRISYQTYLLLPAILLLMAMTHLTDSWSAAGKRVIIAMTALTLTLELLGCINFVWKVRVSPCSHCFDEWGYGNYAPNRGTKAAGYIVRRWIQTAWRSDPQQAITVVASEFDMSFAIFSGLNAGEKGWPFIPEFGPDRPLHALFPVPALSDRDAGAGTHTAPLVYLLDLSGTATNAAAAAFLLRSQDLLCYRIRPATPDAGQAIVYIKPPPCTLTPPLPPGEVDPAKLEEAFDREFTRYTDFFPRSLVQREERAILRRTP